MAFIKTSKWWAVFLFLDFFATSCFVISGVFNVIEQVLYSVMLAILSLARDHIWRQSVVKTKTWHTCRRRVCHADIFTTFFVYCDLYMESICFKQRRGKKTTYSYTDTRWQLLWRFLVVRNSQQVVKFSFCLRFSIFLLCK